MKNLEYTFTVNEDLSKKVVDFLFENNIPFSVKPVGEIEVESNETIKELTVKLSKIKSFFKENKIEPKQIDIHLNHHYHPDYNCDQIWFSAAGYNWDTNDEELEKINYDIDDIIYSYSGGDNIFDLYARCYELNSEDIKDICNEIEFDINDIIEESDDDN